VTVQLNKDVRYIKGVGEKRAALLGKLGIKTVRDLFEHFPMRYEDRRRIQKIAMVNNGDSALVRGAVKEIRGIRLKSGKNLMKVIVNDSSGELELLAFNQPYIKNILKKGDEIYVYGKYKRSRGGLKTSSFTYEVTGDNNNEDKIHTGRIVPVYNLTSGLNQRWLRKLIYEQIKELDREFREFIPDSIIKAEKLLEINNAVRKAHFPQSMEDKDEALKRLIFGEFLIFQAALAFKRNSVKKAVKPWKYELKKNLLTPFKEKLGFEFTKDQKRVINEIFKDMLSIHPMKRLLQGEVGSGKTAVAVSALLLAAENGYLGVVAAPTEILAEQHYMTIKSHVRGLGVKVALLSGNTPPAKRKKILAETAGGGINILVGTHALFQEDVDLSRASIAVIDEQHRFGVRQKAALTGKSENMDVLAMSATPIPRTLALSSYGDLDISTIKELPADRKKPVTRHVTEKEAYAFAVEEIKKGNHIYIVHPLIEESDTNEWKSAEKRFEELGSTVFKNFPCGLLHGRMSGREKEAAMKKFAKGEYKVLFTTTVVEVGIDIPKATVMIIENFNRYGLAAIHQLRGRIARSRRQPYCFLTGKTTTPQSGRRLEIILNSSDGFEIAEEDLKLRGGGELFGTRQHGLMDFKVGSPLENFDLLKLARKYAFSIAETDRFFDGADNAGLRKKIFRKYGGRFHLADIS